MASLVSPEESLGFNLEWIADGGVISDICPSQLIKTEMVDPDSEAAFKPEVEEYVEIQVTEEEVISDQWESQANGHLEDPMSYHIESTEPELVVSLLEEEQDEYSRLHPYPCDFCSRRFSTKSSLSSHMITHRVEKSHVCNLCGLKCKKRSELSEHMKNHAYIPSPPEPDLFQFSPPNNKNKKKVKTVLTNNGVEFYGVEDYDYDLSPRKPKKSQIELASPSKSSISGYSDYMESPTLEPSPPKFQVVDPKRPYVCQHCGVGFAREKALNSHLLIHEEQSAFECEYCHDVFQSEALLREHVVKHGIKYSNSGSHSSKSKITSEDKRTASFQCDICDLRFAWYNQLKKHRKIHKREEGISKNHPCTLCHLQFHTLEELLLHKEDHETEEALHCCNLCREEFTTADELQRHVSAEHKSKHVCHICDSVFKDARSLAKHASTHLETRTYPCILCNRRFHNRAKLRRHLAIHEGEGPFECSECGLTLADSSALTSHKKLHHVSRTSSGTRLFPCYHCGKSFTSRSSQQIHVRVHTGERPYACKYCWKAFADGGTLRKHERIHTGEKPYVCPVCSKAFNQRVVLREHVRAHHSGAGSVKSSNCYECTVCGQMFGNSTELCAHLVRHSDENTAKQRTTPAAATTITSSTKLPRKVVETPMPPSPPPPPPPPAPATSKKAKSPAILVSPKRKGRKRRAPEAKKVDIKVEPVEEVVSDSKKARIVKTSGRKGQNKRFTRGRGRPRLATGLSYASKYAVSRPENQEEHNITIREAGVHSIKGNATAEIKEEPEDARVARTRPRTKNVNYHRPLPGLEPATFPMDAQDDVDQQFVNGIDPSLLEEKVEFPEIETCIVDDIGVELKLEVRTSESDAISDPMSDVTPDANAIIRCELCSERFASKGDLLKHIKLHI